MKKNTVTLVLSYCLYKDGTRLSKMAKKSAELGITAVCAGEASHIIFSTAYYCWRKESEFKKEMAFKAGIKPEKIIIIEGVRHTFDEVKELGDILGAMNAKKLIVIVEKYHAPRAIAMLEEKFPKIQFDFRLFQTKYERTLEPCNNTVIRLLKEHRGSLPTWWLWNTLCNLVWAHR